MSEAKARTSRGTARNRNRKSPPKSSSLPSGSDSSLMPRRWIRTGLCRFCLQPIEAVQPGGSDVRHVGGAAYGECR